MRTILAGKYPQNIAHDAWLSGVLGRDAFRVSLDERFVNYPGVINVFKLHENVFFYAKVSVEDLAGISFLQLQGFSLVDTNVVFEKATEKKPLTVQGVTIRLARPEDKEEVKALAAACFRYSRFHLDPSIEPATANRIKAEWVGNFFGGGWGQAMIVAQKGSEIAGFLLLLDDNKGAIRIDLIGVAENSRGQGIAEDMVNFAQAQFAKASKIIVGTQIANVPSIRCYEKLGFKYIKAVYVFHFHG
jgi:ribosomal protein S18 acetylase RimI-like enzyme